MFNGDTLNGRGWLIYRKAGRAVFSEAGGSGGADDSWRDQDYEYELAYRPSLEKGQAAGSGYEGPRRIWCFKFKSSKEKDRELFICGWFYCFRVGVNLLHWQQMQGRTIRFK